ncbi:response regulator receiver domain-containing protein [Novosphingobium sp. PhB165]|uniref:response regulator n=1 Tax=Novosphingobium sp. PhB165 TaxID=2485105 RepID=UPI0010E9BDE7|nr:response regulator [Novosphingobium sp. PhB165]TCM13020.1 response regulator receiver domain-containing protein [Novosphingobium sp. PhB165]
MCAPLAEDDPATAVFVKCGLTANGIVTRMVESGPEALEFGAAETFDVIILDRMLPGLEGLDVLSKLRASANWIRRLPVSGGARDASAPAQQRL